MPCRHGAAPPKRVRPDPRPRSDGAGRPGLYAAGSGAAAASVRIGRGAP